ncbi:ShlB/FhaC/HecB family hemolysin secretion/activation protein [Cognatiyoonia sp. IB215182]|uniref:ShlB/FhaC/HecB family hemolysin secretion/activation protein n=1 Tax=Cognatiyoonia sp. IB215182 TaxID=3097353 RepID=UPI002A23AC06|nr:ShlB/FhaC/HecB family hemolysin secretion/activation protein [Cognatiyoonia sp. IB215182]
MHAQSAEEQAAAQAAAIQREQAQAQQDPVIDAPDGARPQAPALVRSAVGQTCIDITDVNVAGVSLISSDRVQRVVAPVQGQCLGLAEINSVLEAITFAYVEAGYIAARAFLPEQDLSDGQLDVVVVEGSLEAIIVNSDPDVAPRQRATAFPGMVGAPVNLRDIEQGLDQLSRLRSVNATMELAAGSESGASVLAVNRQVGRRWHASLGLDDQGSASTGEYQSRLSFGYDDLLGLNDTLSLTYQRSMDDSPLSFSDNRPHGDTWTARFEVPYGYWSFALDGNRNAYKSQIDGAIDPIETSGNSSTKNVRVSRIVHRDQISKTTAAGTLTAKETESFILGSRIDVSSRRLSIFNLDVSHSRQIWGGQGLASLGVSRGLDILGAIVDNDAPDGAPVAQFTKYDFALGYARNFAIQVQSVTYNVRLTGQWSDDLLFGSEQMSLGGHSSVRGAESALLFGNRGLTLRNEFAMPVAFFDHQKYAQAFGQIVPYLAIDLGRVAPQAPYGIPGGNLSGTAFGLRSQGGHMSFDISYADVLNLPDNLPAARPDSGVFAASLSISL